MKSVQSQLRYLESTANIKSSISKLTGRTPNTSTAESILVYLQQGRMFLETAASAPFEIRPLILYYGISAYAKAIVCVKRFTNASNLAASHGLKDISNHTSLLNSLTVKIEGNGLFQAFNDEINASEGIYYCINATWHKHNTPAALSSELAGVAISLKDILSRIRSLSMLYELTFAEKSNAQQFELHFFQNEPTMRIDVPELITDRNSLIQIIVNLRERFPALKEWRFDSAQVAWGNTVLEFANNPYDAAVEFDEHVMMLTNDNIYKVNLTATPEQILNKKTFQEIIGFVGGGQRNEFPHFVTPYENKYFAQASLMLIGMFMLSSLVRYRPATWIHSITHSVTQSRVLDDQLLALIEVFIEDTVSYFIDITQVVCGVQHS